MNINIDRLAESYWAKYDPQYMDEGRPYEEMIRDLQYEIDFYEFDEDDVEESIQEAKRIIARCEKADEYDELDYSNIYDQIKEHGLKLS